MAQNQSIESLYKRYLANELNEEELADFLQRLHNATDEETVSRLMDGTWEEMYEKEADVAEKARVVPMHRRRAFKWVAAACIILVTGYGLWVTRRESSNVKRESIEVAKANDVPAPKETRAVITLADGSKVYLDSVNSGTIAQENNVSVVKNDKGEIMYDATLRGPQGDIVKYNTLFNPRGSKVISLTLSDGTRVWLNSESSLRYPTAFTATTREVEITGEAYFEVRHNSKQPFKVYLPNGGVVEDIGTSFNINAYNDEADIKTTLVEGAVNVIARSDAGATKQAPPAVRLSPGQQAIVSNPVNPSIRLIRVQTADIEKITSWKNNEFNFQDDDIQTIMRQLARWYNIQPIITAPSQSNYTGRITREVPLSEVLKMFERVGYVKFEIKDRVVRVIPTQ